MLNLFHKLIKKNILVHKKALILLFTTFGSFFSYIFYKMLVIKPNGVYIGHPNAWSDWALHISITNIFAFKPMNEWFLYHPYYANGKLTYGFLSHLITGLLMKLGLPINIAFFITSITFLFTFLLGLYVLYFALSNSKKQTLLGIFIFFTSSGLGIFRYLKMLNLNTILHPIQDYTTFPEYQWLAGNIPAAMLIPQRAFFIGVSIGVWVLNILIYAISLKRKKKKNLQRKLFLTAGILAGILPIAHMHSFIAIVIITATICFFNKDNFKQLSFFVVPAGLISTFLFFKFIYGGIEIDNFMQISIFWTAQKNIFSWVIMWLKVWGLFLPIVILSLTLFKKKLFSSKPKIFQKNISFYLGFIMLFIIGNIVIFQPTAWDNTKLFAWVYLGFSILVSQFIFTIYKKNTSLKIITVIILITLSASGVVEILRVFDQSKNPYQLSSSEEIALAEKIKNNTATDAIFVTSLVHNHPIPLWASRQMYLGYLGWVRNFGFDHTTREKQIYEIYAGGKKANQYIRENQISYIYLGNREKELLKINEEYLKQFPVSFENSNTKIFDTRILWQ